MGHQPRIFIWDIKEKKILREFKSHKFGVLSLAFSPNMKYLVSVGFQVKKKFFFNSENSNFLIILFLARRIFVCLGLEKRGQVSRE